MSALETGWLDDARETMGWHDDAVETGCWDV
jgi:hypothetical protein